MWWATNCPMINVIPHISWMGTVKTAQRHRKGPGQRPLIPHPRPKQKAPETNWKSTLALVGSKTGFPNKLYSLFLMHVKVKTFINNPNPRTNINSGFQFSLICRNWRIFYRRVIPDAIKPMAKSMPTTKTTTWSFSCSQASNPLILLFAMKKPKMGRRIPMTITTIALAWWS